MPDLIHVQQTVFTIAGVPIQRGDVLAFAVMIPLVFALTWFINRTRLGGRCAPPPRTPRPPG